jgi:DNA modification methylase
MPNCPECHALWSGETTFNTWPSFEGSSIVKYTYNKRPKYLKDHPAPMNPSLVADLILAYSKPGEIVLEPFAGTGTTPVQAIKAGRRFRAYEINDKYFKLATRWIDETWVKSQEKWSAGF